uniref:FXYD domain-containing ion transport regulator n=1 Tax=Laticauda laticaudata TaxID=8630 RepID=A0A8C5SLT5_LATLA
MNDFTQSILNQNKAIEIKYSVALPGHCILTLCSLYSSETSQPVDPFSYDYDTLRLVGMILASIMFVMGILIALSESPLFDEGPGKGAPQCGMLV